jgi:Zn-dependent protease
LLALLQLAGSQGEQTLAALRANPSGIRTRLEASLKVQTRADQLGQAAPVEPRYKLAADSLQIIEAANAEAEETALDFVDTRLLLLGMLRRPQSGAGQILQQYGVETDAFRQKANLQNGVPVDVPRFRKREGGLRKSWLPVQLSPIFIGVVLFTVISGYLSYAGIGNSRRTLFLFVVGGWMISLTLHEFGHALVGYWGGDTSVIDKGYLTLNPLKYTHPFLSIVLPMLFLVMGGIGLPGGAVYINRLAIRKYFVHSLVSAAGPLATLFFGLLLSVPFFLNWHQATLFDHFDFWAGLSFLIWLQMIALLLNLLPIPGLDGFGIIEPFLPPNILQIANAIRPFGLLILIFLFFGASGVTQEFWELVRSVILLLHGDIGSLGVEGFRLFRFWTSF